MKKKHTSIRWKLIKGTKEKLSKLKKGKYTLEFQGYGYDQEKEINDAEFIVEACNNYERLQSENERMRELLDEIQAELFIQIDDGEPINARKYRSKIQTLLNPK